MPIPPDPAPELQSVPRHAAAIEAAFGLAVKQYAG